MWLHAARHSRLHLNQPWNDLKYKIIRSEIQETHTDMKGDRHLEGFKKLTHPFEEIIRKQVTVVIKVNSKLSKHGLYTCPFCILLMTSPNL
jgi:hypothetical protein